MVWVGVGRLGESDGSRAPSDWVVPTDFERGHSDLVGETFSCAGYGWVTSHVSRMTVATLMNNAGLSARQAADQFGRSKIEITQDLYGGLKVAPTGARDVPGMVSISPEPESISGGYLGTELGRDHVDGV